MRVKLLCLLKLRKQAAVQLESRGEVIQGLFVVFIVQICLAVHAGFDDFALDLVGQIANLPYISIGRDAAGGMKN